MVHDCYVKSASTIHGITDILAMFRAEVENKVGLFQVCFLGRLKKLKEGRRGFFMVIGVMIEKTGIRLLDCGE